MEYGQGSGLLRRGQAPVGGVLEWLCREQMTGTARE